MGLGQPAFLEPCCPQPQPGLAAPLWEASDTSRGCVGGTGVPEQVAPCPIIMTPEQPPQWGSLGLQSSKRGCIYAIAWSATMPRCPFGDAGSPGPGPAEVPGVSPTVMGRHSHGSPAPQCSHCGQLRLPGETGKQDALLSGALTAPLGQPGRTGPRSGAGRGEHGCIGTSRSGTPRRVRRAGEGCGERLTADSSCWACLSGSL